MTDAMAQLIAGVILIGIAATAAFIAYRVGQKYVVRKELRADERHHPARMPFVVDPVLELVERRVGGALIIELAGHFVLETCRRFELLIVNRVDCGETRIIIDLGGINAPIRAAGVGTLVFISEYCSNHGAALRLVDLPDRVLEVLSLTGTIGLFQTHGNTDEALASFASDPSA